MIINFWYFFLLVAASLWNEATAFFFLLLLLSIFITRKLNICAHCMYSFFFLLSTNKRGKKPTRFTHLCVAKFTWLNGKLMARNDFGLTTKDVSASATTAAAAGWMVFILWIQNNLRNVVPIIVIYQWTTLFCITVASYAANVMSRKTNEQIF